MLEMRITVQEHRDRIAVGAHVPQDQEDMPTDVEVLIVDKLFHTIVPVLDKFKEDMKEDSALQVIAKMKHEMRKEGYTDD